MKHMFENICFLSRIELFPIQNTAMDIFHSVVFMKIDGNFT